MKRGKSDRETCELNGWAVGTRLVGDEGYGPTVIRITAIGEHQLMAVCESHNGDPCLRRGEARWVLWCREWSLAPAWPPPPAEGWFVRSCRGRWTCATIHNWDGDYDYDCGTHHKSFTEAALEFNERIAS